MRSEGIQNLPEGENIWTVTPPKQTVVDKCIPQQNTDTEISTINEGKIQVLKSNIIYIYIYINNIMYPAFFPAKVEQSNANYLLPASAGLKTRGQYQIYYTIKCLGMCIFLNFVLIPKNTNRFIA